MASLASPSRRQHQAKAVGRSALKARDALVLEHLPLADAIASAAARHLFPLVEREDLIQVAREALVRSAPRCKAGDPPAPYLRRWLFSFGGVVRIDASLALWQEHKQWLQADMAAYPRRRLRKKTIKAGGDRRGAGSATR